MLTYPSTLLTCEAAESTGRSLSWKRGAPSFKLLLPFVASFLDFFGSTFCFLRFTAELLASLLSIPNSKSLLRYI